MATATPIILVQELQENKALWYKIHVFVYDLRNFRENDDSRGRLDSIIDASYIGMPYFAEEEVQAIKSTTVQGTKNLEAVIRETLEERLNRRMKKRVKSDDYRVCAAHDLAPIFEKGLSIDHKRLAKDSEFLNLMEQRKLRLPDDKGWDGLGKKKIIVRSAQEKKKKGRR